MTVIRLIVPAIVAVLAWFASNALAHVAVANESSRARLLLGVIAPNTTIALDAPAPWGVVLGCASALAIGAAVIFFTVLLGPARDRRGFVAVWFGTIVAGTLMATASLIGALLIAASGPAAFTEFAPERLAVASLWGLFWGWIPALAAYLLAARNEHAAASVAPAGPAPRMRLLLAITAAAAVLGLVTAAVAEPEARDALRAELRAEIPEEAAAPVPSGTPVPEIALGEWQVDPLWCTDNQLEFSASRPDAAAGSRAMTIRATNIGQAPCVLDGYPDIAFSDPVTSALDVRIEHGAAMGADDAGAVRLELGPGAVAASTIAWRAMSTTNSDRDPAGWLHVAPYHGGIRQMLTIETDIIGEKVVVTAWRAGEPAAPVAPLG